MYAYQSHPGEWYPPEVPMTDIMPGDWSALVLAWEGEPLRVGYDRLADAMSEGQSWIWKILMGLLGKLRGEMPSEFWPAAAAEWPGRLVLLDAEGREVAR